MRPAPLALLLGTALALIGCRPPEVVPTVDLDRYAGLWYELAAYPTSFQEGCVGSTAEYGLLEEDPVVLSVFNTCYEADGETRTIRGTARPTNDGNSKLSVSFNLFPAPYWIIDLDPSFGSQPYEWAVVSDPTRSFLWILTREPSLDDETLEGIFDRLEDQDYDLDKLEWGAFDL
jgi:apolipoprotein D and lipocalin family protein